MPLAARAAPPSVSRPRAGARGGAVPAAPSLRRFAWVAYVAAAGVALARYGCPVARFFHTPCPGCGTTRAGLALLRGDVHAALALQPIAPAVFALVGALLVRALWLSARDGTTSRLFEGPLGRAIVALGAVCTLAEVGLWIARSFGLFGGPVPV
jgi:hypothetical protein